MPKAFAVVEGRPLLEWSLDVLREVCDRVVVAVPQGYEDEPNRVSGGPSRSESVRQALSVAPEATVAVVHDAARPLVTVELVKRCIAALEPDWDGAIAAAPMTDTVKEAGADSHVVRTLDRSRLWSVQTPQVFRAEVLRRALAVHEHTLAGATDDAALVEEAGGRVRIVESSPTNLKVSTPLDMRVAAELLRC